MMNRAANVAKVPKQNSRLTILLSLNAAAILIVGIGIISAIWLNGGLEFRAVGERSDIVSNDIMEAILIDPASNSSANIELDNNTNHDDYFSTSSHEFDNSSVSSSELWNEAAITIYATPDVDICVGGGLTNLGEMYWQTSNSDVIGGFYNAARAWLGYDDSTCRYPVITGVGTTTITAGTYDGKRKDSIIVTVIAPPIEQWKYDVLSLVNKIRIKNNLTQLGWGATCASAAELRATEIMTSYSHTRPDGASWSTVCPTPDSGGTSGENLAIGNAAVSPASVVSLWMNSEGHRANILNPDYTKLAVGFIFDPNSEYRTYWTQFFSTY